MSDLPFAITASFVRPANTTQYTIGDLVANNATSSLVIVPSFLTARNKNDGCLIRRVRLFKSGTSLTSASFRVYLFNQPPVPTVGDNGQLNNSSALAVDTVAGLVGFFDIIMTRSGVIGAEGAGVPDSGFDIIVAPRSDANLYALIEATAAYTPASGETFNVTIEGLR